MSRPTDRGRPADSSSNSARIHFIELERLRTKVKRLRYAINDVERTIEEVYKSASLKTQRSYGLTVRQQTLLLACSSVKAPVEWTPEYESEWDALVSYQYAEYADGGDILMRITRAGKKHAAVLRKRKKDEP